MDTDGKQRADSQPKAGTGRRTQRGKDHPDKLNKLYDSEQTVTLHRNPGWLTSTSIQIIAPHYSGHMCANLSL